MMPPRPEKWRRVLRTTLKAYSNISFARQRADLLQNDLTEARRFTRNLKFEILETPKNEDFALWSDIILLLDGHNNVKKEVEEDGSQHITHL